MNNVDDRRQTGSFVFVLVSLSLLKSDDVLFLSPLVTNATSCFKSSSLSSSSWTSSSSPHHQTCDKCKLKQVQVTETGRIDLDGATHREYSSVKPRNGSAESCFTPFHVVLLGSSCPFQVEHHRTCTIFALSHKKWLKMSSDEVLGQIWKSNGWQGKIFEQFETAPAVCLTQLIWFRLTAREGRTQQWIDAACWC